MCVVFFDYQRSGAYPILLAANREENINRPATKPVIKTHNNILYVLAGEDKGRDGHAQEIGTWLGINLYGMVVAVTNRTDGKVHGSDKLKSRGVLCHEMLKWFTPLGAVDQCIKTLKAGGYGGCNFIVLDGYDGWVIHAPDKDNVTYECIKPGFHAITNSNLDDMDDERVKFLHENQPTWENSTEAFAAKAKELCSHEKIIVNDDDWGSVSSSIILAGDGGTGMRTKFHHSMTKPTVTSYDDLSEMTRLFSTH